MPYAELDDVRAVLGRPWVDVDETVPDAAGLTVASARFAAVARDVVVEVVRRALTNPDGMQSESLDDWRGTRTTEAARGGVFLLDAEVARLARWSGGGAAPGVAFVSVSG